MKLLVSVLILLSLSACIDEERASEPEAPEENVESEEFTREEIVQSQLLALTDRTIQEPLDEPLETSFFEEDFMLVHVASTNEEAEEIPLIYGVTDGEVEVTRIAPKDGKLPAKVDGTIVTGSSDFEMDTATMKVIERNFSDNLLTLIIQTMNLEEVPLEFTQTDAGIFVDQAENEFRALSGSLD